MPSESDHIALANKNQQTLEFLMTDAEKHPEWIATVSFYKALQIIEAVFARDPDVPSRSDHNTRLEELKTRQKYQPIFKHYRVLWQTSTIARYLCDTTRKRSYREFTDHIPAIEVVSKIVKKRLRTVEQLSVQFLSEQAKSTLIRIPSQ